MTILSVTFDELEHTGDATHYREIIEMCGGEVIDWDFAFEVEQGTAKIKVDDKYSFLVKLSESPAEGMFTTNG